MLCAIFIIMKKAFTLSEVLITLGIIGVVAALAMPSLISSYRKRVVETRLAKFYSTINNAIKLSEIDNGDISTWSSPGGGASVGNIWYNTYLAKYLPTSKGRPAPKNNRYLVYFPDGSALFVDTSAHFFINAKDAGSVPPDIMGTKVFMFSYTNRGFEPYGFDKSDTVLKDDAASGCNRTSAGDRPRAYCAELIRRNGWKIPDDYPLKF